MCHIDTEECPEEHGRYDICAISTLEICDEDEDYTEGSDRIVEIRRTTDRPSHISHPDGDIQCCRHDDPCECELDTRPDDDMCRPRASEYICEESEDREHHDECDSDIEIAPWEEPDGRESDGERKKNKRLGIDFRFSLLEECHIHSGSHPREIYQRPYSKSDSSRCD